MSIEISFTKRILTQNNAGRRQIASSRTDVFGALFWILPSARSHLTRLRRARIKMKGILLQDFKDILHLGSTRPVISYTTVITKEPRPPQLAVGQTQPENYIVSTKTKPQVLINNHSVTPRCYIVIKDDSVLRAATEIGKIHQLDKFRMREFCIVLRR